MPERKKYKIGAESQVPFISSMFSLFGVIILCVVHCTTFLWFFLNETKSTPTIQRTVIVYSIVIIGMLTYSLFTGILAKKTLFFSGLFALPVSLFYLLNVSGIVSTLIYFDFGNVLHFYRDNPFLKAAWPLVIVLVILTIASIISFTASSLNRIKAKPVHVMIQGVNAIAWLFYSVYSVVMLEYPRLIGTIPNALYGAKEVEYAAGDFVFAILSYLAAVAFFMSKFLIVSALKRYDGKTVKIDADSKEDEDDVPVVVAAVDEQPLADAWEAGGDDSPEQLSELLDELESQSGAADKKAKPKFKDLFKKKGAASDQPDGAEVPMPEPEAELPTPEPEDDADATEKKARPTLKDILKKKKAASEQSDVAETPAPEPDAEAAATEKKARPKLLDILKKKNTSSDQSDGAEAPTPEIKAATDKEAKVKPKKQNKKAKSNRPDEADAPTPEPEAVTEKEIKAKPKKQSKKKNP